MAKRTAVRRPVADWIIHHPNREFTTNDVLADLPTIRRQSLHACLSALTDVPGFNLKQLGAGVYIYRQGDSKDDYPPIEAPSEKVELKELKKDDILEVVGIGTDASIIIARNVDTGKLYRVEEF